MDHRYPGAAASTFAALFAGGFLFVWLALVVFGLYVNWRIAAKAGYAGALSLLMLIPVFNIVVVLIFAFSKWPIEEQLAVARGYSPGAGGG